MDDYHFHRDPATLIEARLTKAEAELVASYRAAHEMSEADGMTNLVIVIAVSRQLITDKSRNLIESIAQDAAQDAVKEMLGWTDGFTSH